MAGWRIHLVGGEQELSVLSGIFTKPDCHVAKDDDGQYYLTSNTFDMATDVTVGFLTAVEALITDMNGPMKVLNVDFQPVRFGGMAHLNDDGSARVTHVVGGVQVILSTSGRVVANGVVLGPDGVVVPSSKTAEAQVRATLGIQHPAIANAYKYWVACKQGDADFWFAANKVYDIIRADVGNGNVGGGTQRIENNGWVTRADIEGFGEAANNPEVSGGKARHGHGWTPKAPPMNEGEAVAFIQHLLDRWLDEKAD